MAEKRKRGQNFSIEDKEKLIKLLLLHKDIILNKKTDGATNEAKNIAWTAITDLFNSSSNTLRSKESLMKVWEKLKGDSKVYRVKMRQSQDESGPSGVKLDPVLEQVCSILGRSCTGILGALDTDAGTGPQNEISVPNVLAISNGTCNRSEQGNSTESTAECEENKIFYEEQLCDVEVTVDEDAQVNNIQGKIHTPLWPRRRPRKSNFNERSEPSALVSSSIQNVYKKKITVEDLKEQLLREELEFKRKLYDLQLQAALKDVEIKTEILERIKGGGLLFNNLFGTELKKD